MIRAALVLLALSAAPAVIACDVARLFDQVHQRLALMPAVAAWKYQRGLPVEDRAREQRVLDQAAVAAERRGLDGAVVARWVEVQVEMAKTVQRQAIHGWREQGVDPPPTADLTETLRPRLLDLMDEQLDSLACLLHRGQRWGFDERDRLMASLVGLAVTAEQETRLWEALLAISRVPIRPPASSS